MPDSGIVRALAPRGALRASINLGNPVLAQGTPDAPSGVTVDLAREIAARLAVPLQLVCFDAARRSFEAITKGDADVCFLAVEPAREGEVAFSSPYAVIDGVYVVPSDSPLRSVADVDAPGVRIGVKQGSAYDLFLTRALAQATLVRGDEGVEVFLADGLEAGAGIRAPVEKFVAAHAGNRLIPGRFMEIQQAVGLPKSTPDDAVRFVADLVDELVANGFVADALSRSGQTSARVPDSGERLDRR